MRGVMDSEKFVETPLLCRRQGFKLYYADEAFKREKNDIIIFRF